MSTVTLNGWAYLAQSSKRIACTLLVSDHDAVLNDQDGQEVLRLPRSNLRFETALGDAPRRATLPDGTLFETTDHTQIATLADANTGATLSTAEQFHPRLFLFVIAAIVGVFLVWRFALRTRIERSDHVFRKTIRPPSSRRASFWVSNAARFTVSISANGRPLLFRFRSLFSSWRTCAALTVIVIMRSSCWPKYNRPLGV